MNSANVADILFLDVCQTCANNMHMKRTNFYFPQDMLDRLKAAKLKTGIPVSEIIRRAIEDFLSKHGL